MTRKEYDTFILTDPSEVIEDTEMEIVVRDLSPADRRYKFEGFHVNAKISKSADKYPDLLQVRLGRGQLFDETWSIEINEFVNKFAQLS
jgi:phenylphosphate carboxylase gamma subunit